jgi:hypothetical protein
VKLPSIVSLLASSLFISVPTFPATAHPGGLDASGCHHNRKTGDYHCHRGSRSTNTTVRALSGSSSVYYRNCSDARAAGVAPIYRGQPGYAAHLDRDNDGIACE